MSNLTLLQQIINYLTRQKSLGKKKVHRTIIYAVMEDRYGEKAIGKGIMMSREVMEQAADAVGGVYVNGDKGRACVVFN